MRLKLPGVCVCMHMRVCAHTCVCVFTLDASKYVCAYVQLISPTRYTCVVCLQVPDCSIVISVWLTTK